MLFALLILTTNTATSLSAENQYTSNIHEFPLLEAPYNITNNGRFPGMYQSQNITKNYYEGIHSIFALGKDQYPFLSLLASAGTDIFLLSTLPGGSAWLHEEAHRAVMGQYGISSFNDVYNMKINAEMISVSHVKDADLQRLKDRHPADMVRLSSAGIEGEYEWISATQEDFFFSGRSTRYEGINWLMSVINSSWYIYSCTTGEADTLTDEMNAIEKNPDQRDFTGLDFTAWVYDLYRPGEPYAARGIHPLGNGFDRYIKHSDLTQNEKKYLKKQFRLSLLNFISPQLYGFDAFIIGEPIEANARFNISCMHFLTSSGSSSELHILSRWNSYNLVSVLRLYQNEKLYLPGTELKLKRFTVKSLPFFFDASALLWLQPKDQMFHETDFMPGGSAALKTVYPLSDVFELYITLRIKSAGWQAGEVSLGNAAGILCGFQCVL